MVELVKKLALLGCSTCVMLLLGELLMRYLIPAWPFEPALYRPYSTRRIRQIIHEYALAAGIQKRVYPHLFRHQIITFLTKKGLISPKLQLLSGHAEEKSLAMYRDLALADVSAEYEAAMQSFPGR
jgi:integrase/recombinase XerD